MPSKYSVSDIEFYETEKVIQAQVNMSNRIGVISRTAFGSTWPIPLEIKFVNLIEIQVYVDKIVASGWSHEKWPRKSKRVLVKPNLLGTENQGIYSGHAYYRGNTIFIPEHGHGESEFMRELYVLHELAHHYGGTDHGKRFRDTLFELIGYKMDSMFAAYYKICLTLAPDNLGD